MVKRSRTATTMQPPKKRAARRQAPLYLDLLPHELSTRIATFITHGSQAPHALSLVEVAPSHTAPVLASLNHTYVFHADSDAQEWSELMHSTVSHADFTRSGIAAHDPKRDPLRILRAPRLRSAALVNDPALFRAVSNAPALHHLSVRFSRMRGTGDAAASLRELLQAVSTLPSLKELVLSCNGTAFCIFHSLLQNDPPHRDRQLFKDACGHLSDLCIRCDHSSALLLLLPLLPNLRGAAFHGPLPPPALPRLANLNRVSIHGAQNVSRILQTVSGKLFALHTREILSVRDMTRLEQCSQMTRLIAGISAGAEQALAGAVGKLPSLSALLLDFSSGRMRLTPTNCKWFPTTKYYKPAKGALLAVVRAAPGLTELTLDNVSVEKEEIEAIVKTIGPRLQRLRFSCADQGEPPLDRAERVLLACAKFCPKVRVVHVREFSPERKEGGQAVEKRRQEIITVVERLKLTAPLFEKEHLLAFLDRFMWDTDSSAATHRWK